MNLEVEGQKHLVHNKYMKIKKKKEKMVDREEAIVQCHTSN